MNVHHGHLVDDDRVRLQRILLVPLKGGRLGAALAVRPARQLQQPVDGLGFTAGGLRHPLGCPARGCRQPDVQPFRLQIADDGIDGRRFARTGAAGDDQQSLAGRFPHGFLLHLIQLHAGIFFNGSDPVIQRCLRYIVAHPQIKQHPGRVHLQIIIIGGVNLHHAVFFLADDLPIHEQIHEILIKILHVHAQDLLDIAL